MEKQRAGCRFTKQNVWLQYIVDFIIVWAAEESEYSRLAITGGDQRQ